MKSLISAIILWCLVEKSYANGVSMFNRELRCANAKKASVVESVLLKDVVSYSDDDATEKKESHRTIYIMNSKSKLKYQVKILIDDSVTEEIYTPFVIKNKKKFNAVFTLHSSSQAKTPDPSTKSDDRYKNVDKEVTIYPGNYFSIWPIEIKCKDGLIEVLKKKNFKISAEETIKYNLFSVKYTKSQNLYFLPPDFLVTLDVKDNWCDNKFCDPSKKMKIKKIERKTQIMIDDDMNIYHIESSPMYTIDFSDQLNEKVIFP